MNIPNELRPLLAMVAAAPTAKAERVQCEFHGDDSSACEKYSGNVPCEPAPAQPAERQEQEEVQRLRVALEHCSEVMKDPWRHGEGCISRAINLADAALLASSGQEVES